MRTITKTEVFIRLLFLVCVISGALVSSVFSSAQPEITKADQPETITLHNTSRN
jgi:Na+-transporting methylmalonyl-CoA/oxaloacetate decarboxylase gamma subunit